MARQWAAQGIRGIIITNPKGEPYVLDRFGMIASAKEENSSDAVGLTKDAQQYERTGLA
jgi:hypothetical protein